MPVPLLGFIMVIKFLYTDLCLRDNECISELLIDMFESYKKGIRFEIIDLILSNDLDNLIFDYVKERFYEGWDKTEEHTDRISYGIKKVLSKYEDMIESYMELNIRTPIHIKALKNKILLIGTA